MHHNYLSMHTASTEASAPTAYGPTEKPALRNKEQPLLAETYKKAHGQPKTLQPKINK